MRWSPARIGSCRPFDYRAAGGDDHKMDWTHVAVVEPPRIQRWRSRSIRPLIPAGPCNPASGGSWPCEARRSKSGPPRPSRSPRSFCTSRTGPTSRPSVDRDGRGFDIGGGAAGEKGGRDLAAAGFCRPPARRSSPAALGSAIVARLGGRQVGKLLVRNARPRGLGWRPERPLGCPGDRRSTAAGRHPATQRRFARYRRRDRADPDRRQGRSGDPHDRSGLYAIRPHRRGAKPRCGSSTAPCMPRARATAGRRRTRAEGDDAIDRLPP